MSKLTKDKLDSIAKMMGYIPIALPRSMSGAYRWCRYVNTDDPIDEEEIASGIRSDWDVSFNFNKLDDYISVTWDIMFLCPHTNHEFISRSCILFITSVLLDENILIDLLSNINERIEDGKAAAEFIVNGPYKWTGREEDMEHLQNNYCE